MAKKNIKVRDLKPRKDAKGGGPVKPSYAAGNPTAASGNPKAGLGAVAPAGSPSAAAGVPNRDL